MEVKRLICEDDEGNQTVLDPTDEVRLPNWRVVTVAEIIEGLRTGRKGKGEQGT